MQSTAMHDMMGLHSINGVDVTLPMDMDGSRLLVHAVQRCVPTTGSRLVKVSWVGMSGERVKQGCVDIRIATYGFLPSVHTQERRMVGYVCII